MFKFIKFLIVAMLIAWFVAIAVEVNAAEPTEQTILNDKNNASINLNSQIKQDETKDKQTITNKASWFNININRNTYKFYCDAAAIK